MGDDDVPDETETVITPGGPRPRDQVHSVRPGEAVRTLPDGTFVIVPDERAHPPTTDDEHDAEDQDEAADGEDVDDRELGSND